MLEKNEQPEQNPLMKVLGPKSDSEKSSSSINQTVISESSKIRASLESITSSLTSVLNSLSKNLTVSSDIAKSVKSGNDKESNQENKRFFQSLFSSLGDRFSDAMGNLGLKIGKMGEKEESSWWSIALQWGVAALLVPLWQIQGIVKGIAAGMDLLRNAFKSFSSTKLGSALSRMTTNMFTSIKNGFASFWKGTGNLATKITGLFRDSIIPKISQFFSRAGTNISNWFKGTFPKTFSFLSETVTKISNGINSTWTKLTQFFTKITQSKWFLKIESMFATVTNLFSRVTNMFKGFSSGIIPKIGLLFKSIMTTVGSVFSKIKTVISGSFGFLSKIPFIGSIILRTLNLFRGILGKVPIIGWIINAIEAVVGAIRGWFGSEGKDIMTRIGETIQGVFAQLIEGLTFGFVRFNTVMGWFKKVTDALGNAFYRTYKFFSTDIPNFFTVTIPNLFYDLMDILKITGLKIGRWAASQLSWISSSAADAEKRFTQQIEEINGVAEARRKRASDAARALEAADPKMIARLKEAAAARQSRDNTDELEQERLDRASTARDANYTIDNYKTMRRLAGYDTDETVSVDAIKEVVMQGRVIGQVTREELQKLTAEINARRAEELAAAREANTQPATVAISSVNAPTQVMAPEESASDSMQQYAVSM